MFVIAHATAGATLGCKIKPNNVKRRLFLITACVGSHIVLDYVPHWDYPYDYTWIFLDLFLAVIVTAIIMFFTGITRAVVSGAFWGAIPDIDYVLIDMGILEEVFFISHLPWFPHGELNLPWGLLIQVVLIIFLVWFSIKHLAVTQKSAKTARWSR